MASENPENKRRMTDVSRRKVIATGGAAWASTALAGCTGSDDGGDSGDTTEPATDTPTDEPTDTDTPEPQPENYVVTDTLRVGSAYVPDGTTNLVSSCSASRTFAPEMQVVFYVGVFDPETGDPIGPDNIDGVSISSDAGDTDLAWTEDESEWHGNIVLPEDTEPGTVTYTIDVSTDASTTQVTLRERQFEVVEYQSAASNYVVTEQTYATSSIDGAEGEDNPTGDHLYASGCLEQDIFTPDDTIGFDIGIWHGQTGNMIGPDDVESAEIQFEDDGVGPVTLEFDGGDDNEWDRTNDSGEIDEEHAWNAVWRNVPAIPDGEDTYRLDYEIVVTPSGEGVEVNPVGVYRDYVTLVPTPSS